MDDAAAASEGSAKAEQKSSSGGAEGTAAGAAPPPTTTTKGAGCPYSSLVAHRALFGPHRRRARKAGGAGDGKAAPSRLSRVSTAEDGTS